MQIINQMQQRWRQLGYLLILTLTGGCVTSPIPAQLNHQPVRNIELTAVQQHPTAFIGQAVRWGGQILRIINHRQQSEIELLAYPLDQSGYPQLNRAGLGRFIAKVTGFIDPNVYAAERLLTVVGAVDATQTGNIGEYNYRYPVIKVATHHLWPAIEPIILATPNPHDHYYYRYSPWYDPYPFGFGVEPWPRSRRHPFSTHLSIGIHGGW
ncbi:Slp family lipoprotein [Thiospirillum jenense]|uniref:Slp family lipoprotein n=1 Tax=Thiospirillum jenense TaxID=1653858 RepID=A0A839HFB3_9GAMM|nr:Slp family lipoprotein [Thiospirillum jenense]